MDKYKFVSLPSTVKALTLPPAFQDKFHFQLPTLPPDKGQQKMAAKMSAFIMIILVVIALLAILYTILLRNADKCHLSHQYGHRKK